MNYLKVPLIVILSAFAIISLIFSFLSKKPLRTLLFNAFLGVATLAIIDLTSKFTNVYIPINIFTVCGSAIYGVPAVCGFLILNLLI